MLDGTGAHDSRRWHDFHQGVELGKVARAHDGTWGIYITFSRHHTQDDAMASALDRIEELVSLQHPARGE